MEAEELIAQLEAEVATLREEVVEALESVHELEGQLSKDSCKSISCHSGISCGTRCKDSGMRAASKVVGSRDMKGRSWRWWRNPIA